MVKVGLRVAPKVAWVVHAEVVVHDERVLYRLILIHKGAERVFFLTQQNNKNNAFGAY